MQGYARNEITAWYKIFLKTHAQISICGHSFAIQAPIAVLLEGIGMCQVPVLPLFQQVPGY